MGSFSPETEPVLPERVGLHVVEPSPSNGSIAVILCCAEADADALAERMDHIEAADVRLVAGLERDTVGLRDELAALAEQSLVVICKTEALDSDAVRRAVECFGLRRTWTHRLLVLELSSPHSASWIGSVHRTLAAMARRRSRPVATTNEVPSVRGEIVGSTHERATAPAPDQPAVVLGAPTPRDPKRDEVGPIPAHVRAPGRRPAHLALVVPTLDDSDDGVASISDACLVPPVVTPAGAPERRRFALPGALAAILAAALVGTLVGANDPFDAPQADPVQATLASDADRRAPVAPAPVAPAPAALPPRPVASPPDVIQVVVTPARDRIDDALADGRAQRYDGWLVWNEAEPASDWWHAANLCRARALAGLRGWRLPTVAEARALRRAGVLPKVDAWTLTRVVGSEGNWVAGADGKFAGRDKHDASAYATCVRKG